MLSERMSHEEHCDYYRHRHITNKHECSCQVAEVRKLESYADKLADGLPMLPKDIEVLREANLDLAVRNEKLEAVVEAAGRAMKNRNETNSEAYFVEAENRIADLEDRE